ncbi:MAG: MFS transporter, partial [Rhodobacterales bacterium]|nr:MFS transporter [Rhodobacterales bacterium]
ALLGYIWLYSPAFVFIVASGIAAISLALSFCIPKKPSATNETIFSKQRIKL